MLPEVRTSQVRASSRRLGALTAVAVLVIGVLGVSCGAGPGAVAAERIDAVRTSGVPFVRVDGAGTLAPDGLRPDESAALAVLSDLRGFAGTLPGSSGEMLTGGYVAVDEGTATGGALCVRRPADLLGTAYYCPEQDAIVVDSAALVPALRGHYGDGAFALALAHEFGHAVQARAGWAADAPPLVVELQADCFAGAFLASAADGSAGYVHIPPQSRARAVAALLDFRDAPDSDPDAAGAHGSATDRLGAVDRGFRLGAPSCGDLTARRVRAATTLGLPGPSVPDGGGTGMRRMLSGAGLPAPAGPTASGTADLGPVARDAATALALALAATGGDATRASCLLGAWAGRPELRSAADQALDQLRSRPAVTWDELQAFSAGVDGGVTVC